MIKYAALGDSLTAGVGGCASGGFVPGYGSLTQQELSRRVIYENLGVSGATTEDVLAIITRYPEVRSVVRTADIVTISAGGNDLVDAGKDFLAHKNKEVFMKVLVQCRKNLDGILSEIRRMKQGSGPFIIRAVDLYNPLPQIPETNEWIQQFNRQLAAFEDGQFRVAHIFSLFDGKQSELLSGDKFHPNWKGYKLIARELHRLGYKPLA